MKTFLFVLLLATLSSCQPDPIDGTLSQVKFSNSPLKALTPEKLKELSNSAEPKFEWKKALVKRVLEEEVEKKNTDVPAKVSDQLMNQAEAELTQPNGLRISGAVFFIPKKKSEKMSDEDKAKTIVEASLFAEKLQNKLLLDPSDENLRTQVIELRKELPDEVSVDLKMDTKLLARFEVATPGWLFLGPILDSHQNSPLDHVASPVRIDSNIFVTILRERINSETLSVDVIRERANELALAATRKQAILNFFQIAAAGVSLELYPDIIQKDGSVE